MITASNPKHPVEIKKQTDHPVEEGGTSVDRRQWKKMDDEEGDLLRKYRFAADFRNDVCLHHGTGYKSNTKVTVSVQNGRINLVTNSFERVLASTDIFTVKTMLLNYLCAEL